jgi:hypothetical protein
VVVEKGDGAAEPSKKKMNLHVFLWLSLLLAVFYSSARLPVCTLGAVDAASASWKNVQFLPAVKKKIVSGRISQI